MPLHPAPPVEVDGLIAAYEAATRALLDVGHGLRDHELALPTACPGWSVKDVLAHVVSLEEYLATGELPDVEVPPSERITTDFQRLTERGVLALRDVAHDELLERLRVAHEQRVAVLYGSPLELDTPITGLWGPAPARDVLRVRTFDTWTHEQDVREAVGRHGNLDCAAAAIALDTLDAALPRIVARSAGIEPGHTVVLDVTGPVLGRLGVRVEEHDGRPHGVRLFTGEADGEAVDSEVTTITASTQALTRRAAGRGTTDDVHWTVATGSEEVARRVLDALPLTP